MKNEVEIIGFMIDAFKINIYNVKIKTKKPKLSESYHLTNRIQKKPNKIQVITTQLVSSSLIKQPKYYLDENLFKTNIKLNKEVL